MAKPFTNAHIHIFDSECAPENFLRILDIKLVRKYPGTIKRLIENNKIKTVIRMLDKFGSRSSRGERSNVSKYISFLSVATQDTQEDIFRRSLAVATRYDARARLVVLALDMQNQDNQGNPPRVGLETQLAEVKKVKTRYPDHCFPFLPCDPRTRAGSQLVDWARKYFEYGVKSAQSGQTYPYFSGIKLYPALGFFPFDPRLDELYAYAEKNGIPVMTHCTRVGSFYVGSEIESLIPRHPPMIEVSGHDQQMARVKAEIHERIDRYYRSGAIANSKIGENDLACDLFGSPVNYVPILLKYPRLKLCLAHMGGEDEFFIEGTPNKRPSVYSAEKSWAREIRDMMIQHPNLYTDVSYTIAAAEHPLQDGFNVGDFINEWMKIKDRNDRLLGERILFGTDYFMTEREGPEGDLFEAAKKMNEDWFLNQSAEVAERYLHQIP